LTKWLYIWKEAVQQCKCFSPVIYKRIEISDISQLIAFIYTVDENFSFCEKLLCYFVCFLSSLLSGNHPHKLEWRRKYHEWRRKYHGVHWACIKTLSRLKWWTHSLLNIIGLIMIAVFWFQWILPVCGATFYQTFCGIWCSQCYTTTV